MPIGASCSIAVNEVLLSRFFSSGRAKYLALRYTEAEPILLRCLSQYGLTGKQDGLLLTILTNLELVFTRRTGC